MDKATAEKMDILRRTIKQLVADAINFGKQSIGSSQYDFYQKMIIAGNDDVHKLIEAMTTPPEAPNHSCGPESNCDGLCVEYSAYVKSQKPLHVSKVTPSKPAEPLRDGLSVTEINEKQWPINVFEKTIRRIHKIAMQNIHLGRDVSNNPVLSIENKAIDLLEFIDAHFSNPQPTDKLLEAVNNAIQCHAINNIQGNLEREFDGVMLKLKLAWQEATKAQGITWDKGDIDTMDAFVSEMTNNGGQCSQEFDNWSERHRSAWKRIKATLGPNGTETSVGTTNKTPGEKS